MHRFRTTLVPGKKRPYASWTFLVIPTDVAMGWGRGRLNVRGTISGCEFRAAASRGEGVLRVPIPRALRERAKLSSGDRVSVTLELDTAARPVAVPKELRAVFRKHPDVGALYKKLPPSYRRAWATHIAEAKHGDTRTHRASKAAAGIRARAYP